MAVCVGCGLEVNNGILEVNVCGDPIQPNITTGGLQCDASSEGGCLKVVLNDTHAGCGLSASQGQLNADLCTNGGILCGPTADDPDQCLYINVQGQGAGPCVATNTITTGTKPVNGCGITERYSPVTPPALPLIGVPTQCGSPNCNGIVRTCDGLWAPPAIPSINFSCGQIARYVRMPLANLIQPLGNQGPLVAGSTDGFANFSADQAYGPSPGESIIVNAFELDPCLDIDAMSWTAFNINYQVKGGELWRFALHERICCTDTNPNALTDINSLCPNTWILQAVQYVDRRSDPANAAINFGSIQINDNSTWRFGRQSTPGEACRMEAMITVNRLVGNTPLDHDALNANFQYRNMGTGFHHRQSQSCGFTDTTA